MEKMNLFVVVFFTREGAYKTSWTFHVVARSMATARRIAFKYGLNCGYYKPEDVYHSDTQNCGELLVEVAKNV